METVFTQCREVALDRWYCVQAHACREAYARDNLIDTGFRPFLPEFKITSRHARKPTEVKRALYPGYLFVSLDLEGDEAATWPLITRCRGVVNLLLTGSLQPRAVRYGIVEGIQRRAELDGGYICLENDPSEPTFFKDQPLRILEGPFTSYTGLYQRSERGRVMVLVSLLGGTVPMILPRTQVEAA